MRKVVVPLLCFLCYTLASGQSVEELLKGETARARMLEAFGGEQAVRLARHFSYTLVRTTSSGDTIRTFYTLDLANRYIRTSSQTAAGTEVKSIDANGAWQSINGQQEPLPQQQVQALRRTFFFNFIPMLQNRQLQFTYLRPWQYQSRPVDIVRVRDPQDSTLVLDLFVDQQNGQVLSSSREKEAGQYVYFADELEYEPIGMGVIFPLLYRMVVDGRVTSEGRFENATISQ